MLRIQDEIAQAAIAEFISNIAVAPSKKPDVDPLAYELYLKAKSAVRAADFVSARTLLESAIAIDSEFSDPCGLLASIHFSRPGHASADESNRLLKKALDLDPTNIAALAAEANLKLYVEFDLQGSISMVESLYKRFPNFGGDYQYLEVLIIACRLEEMQLVSERAQRLYPHSSRTAYVQYHAEMEIGEFDRAGRALNRIPLEPVGPDCWSGRRCWQICVDIASGRLEAAEDNIKVLSQYCILNEIDFPQEIFFRTWLAIQQGQLDVARALYRPSPAAMAATAPNWLPLDAILTGDTSRTLDEIENPTRPGSINWIMRLRSRERWIAKYGATASKEAFAALQKEPRYQQALIKYGIDDETLAKIQVHTDELWD